MSRRNRHFNPAGLGCTVALDARFITGIANGGAVATWTGRPGTSINATQGTALNQPTFQSTALNGRSVVRFDGSNDFMTASPNPSFPYALFVAVATSDTDGTIASNERVSGSFSQEGLVTASGNLTLNQQNGSAATLSISSSSANPMIATVIWAGNNTSFTGTIRRNGVTVAGPTSGTGVRDSTAVSRTLRLGDLRIVSFPLSGDYGAVVLLPGTLTDPICKRIEHHLAFSFGVACA